MTRLIYTIISLLTLFPWSISSAQNLAWVGNLANATTDVTIEAVTQDGNSDIYIVGSFQETVDFDMGGGVFNLSSPGNRDIFVAKYDLNGNFIRAFQIGDANAGNLSFAYDIAVDASDNIVIVGSFTTNGVAAANFAPLGGTPTMLNSAIANTPSTYIAKYNSLGQCIWGFRIGNDSNQNVFYGVSIDGADNIYVGGKMRIGTIPVNFNPLGTAQNLTSSSTTQTDAILVKYNSNGLYQWSNIIGNGSTSNITENIVVSGSFVYIVGRYQSTTNFNPNGTAINRTSLGSYDGFIAQYNAMTGLCNWAGSIGSTATQDIIRAVDADAAGNVYIGGEFRNTVDLNIGAGTSNITAIGTIDFYVAKYNTAGALAWGFAVGQSSVNAVFGVDVDNTNLYITGRFRNTADFNHGAGTANLTALSATTDATFLGKYSTVDGSYINAFSIDGVDANGGFDLYADAGVVYLVGFFNGSNVDFDPSAATAYMNSTSTAPIYDGFVACYSEAPVSSIEDVAITEWIANPFGTESEGEWIEIYNFGSTAVNLKDWRLKDEDTDNAVISTTDLFLPAGERFILARNKAKFEELWLTGCPDSRVIQVGMVFANTLDEIVLENAAGDVVWSVAYQSDDTEGRATFYTEATYTNRYWGSKAAPGIVRAGNDVTGTLGYQKNNSTTDVNAVTNLRGDIGSPLNIQMPENTRGNTLVLDGVNDYLNLGTLAAIEGQTGFTFETWIRPITIDVNSERIFSKRGTNTSRIEISLGSGTLEIDRQHLEINVCNGLSETVTTANGSIPLGQWSHVVVVFDGTLSGSNRLKVYVNGIAQTVIGTLSATTTPSGSNVNIGRRPDNGNRPSNIELDEIRIWNIARTEVQNRERMHLTLSNCSTGLVAYYQLNETSGTIAKDLRGADAIYGDGVTATTFPTRATSIVNTGYGQASVSQTILGVGTGVQTFATANLVMEIDAHSNSEDITVTYQTFTPNLVTGIDATNIIQNPMWTVNTSKSTETIKTSYIFTFSAGILTSTNPLKYGLYWRPMNSGGIWTKVATATSVTTTTIKFANMSLTGQLMVVQESSDLISDVRGNMYTFDNTLDKINCPTLTVSNVSFTIELWARRFSTTTEDHLFGQGTPGVTRQGLHARFNPGNSIVFAFWNDDLSVTHAAATDGQWHHYTFTYNSTTRLREIFIDGVRVGSNNSGGNFVGPVGMNIGNHVPGAENATNAMDGAIEEFRVWSGVVRTQAQIRENMHLTLKGNETGLLAYYQFNIDDVIGAIGGVRDAMGAHDGTAQNMATGAYLPSEVAVAGGTSDRGTVVAGGVYDFANTGVHMEFGASAPNGEIVVYRLETEKPHGANFITGDVDNEYFVVRNFGTLTFAPLLDITFGRLSYIDLADISLPQASSPFQLYKRSDNAYGNTWGTSWGGADNATAGSNGSVGYNTANNITSFSQIVIVNTNANSDLPVELLYFEAERSNADEVQLNWATATETNNQGFYLERMLDNENQFSEIAWIDGHGTTTNTNYYGHLDINSHLGTSYYRLRQVDYDGTKSYSDIKAVTGRSSGKYIDCSIYPNPVKDKLTLEFKQLPKQVNTATIKVLSVDGKLLHQFSQKITSNQFVSIDFVAELHPGVYMLAIETNDEEIVMQKFVKE